MVMQLMAILEALHRQFRDDPERMAQAGVEDNLTRLSEEFFPKRFQGHQPGPYTGAIDNDGYIDIPEK